MGTVRFLFGAALLLGGCDLLWSTFNGPNPAYCDPSSPLCTNPGDADGGNSDGAVGDGGIADASGAGNPDLAQNPDLQCNPGTTSPWVVETPPSATTIALSGVTGNGAGDIWVVGPPSYVAHLATSWNMIDVSLTPLTTLGRVVYAPNQAQALALGVTGGLLGGGQVMHLAKNSATADGVTLLPSGPFNGIWVSASTESTPYIVGADGTFYSYNGVAWTTLNNQAPVHLSVISGTGSANSTTIWGTDAADSLAAAYPGPGVAWRTVTTAANVFNSVWASPGGGVFLVGNNGKISTISTMVPPIAPLVAMYSPVNSTLYDVAGTKTGHDLWAVGAGGTVLHWESKCQTWTPETSPTTKSLNAVWVSDSEQMVWAVGANGTVMHRFFP